MVVKEYVPIRDKDKKRVMDVEVMLIDQKFEIGHLLIKEKKKITVCILWPEIVRQVADYLQKKYNVKAEFISRKHSAEEKSKIA